MRYFPVAAPLLLLAACVAPEAPPPAAPPPPPPAAPPPPAPISQDWRDWPLTPGSWAYRPDGAGSTALFGRPGAEADLMVRCDSAARRITLSWPASLGAAATTAFFTTSNGSAAYPIEAAIGVQGRAGIGLAATDAFLDKLAFSRGRFIVAFGASLAPAGRLVIPAWPEPARAIEDCRK